MEDRVTGKLTENSAVSFWFMVYQEDGSVSGDLVANKILKHWEISCSIFSSQLLSGIFYDDF